MTDYDAFLSQLDAFVEYAASTVHNRNEATTRFQLIDRLLFDCLGWAKNDVVLEDSMGGQYADYVFSAPRRVLVVEAKREGSHFEVPVGSRLQISIPGLIRGNDSLKAALEQVSGYCQERGVPLGAVANGHQLVLFLATRGDGVPPLQGAALVFGTLAAMQENALDLWNCLSPQGMRAKNAIHRLIGPASQPVPPKLSATLARYPGIKGRNVFQTELQILSELVMEDVTRSRELEEQFLRDCYCQSGALSQYALISRELLQARYASLFGEHDPGLTTVPATSKDGVSSDLLADSLTNRPVLLLGDVGVGKTTFIRHLMKVEASSVFDNAVALYIDLGTQATLSPDLRAFVLNDIARQLFEHFEIDVDSNAFVRDLYRKELGRFTTGLYGDLRETQPGLYRVKEVEFLESKVREREVHLRNAVHRLATSHRKQVVVFLDNCDQRDHEVQQQAFLISQELASHWDATVFVTLRPETFHRSVRSGALSGYHPKAFTVLPPRIDRVLEKRLAFALEITSGRIPIKLVPGVKVQLSRLESVIRPLKDTLDRNDEFVEFIDNVAAGNVRLALDFVKGFLGSGHVDTKKIAEIYESTGRYYVPLHELVRAVTYGDSVHYDPTRSPIANLLDVSTNDGREHFLLPVLLNTLAKWTGPGMEGGFVETGELYARLQGYGFTPDQVDAAVLRGLFHKLLEAADREMPDNKREMAGALRVTTAGIYHVERLLQMFAYIDAVCVDTPVLARSEREAVHDARSIEERLTRAETFLWYLDEQWRQVEDTSKWPFDWARASAAVRTQLARVGAIVASRGGDSPEKSAD